MKKFICMLIAGLMPVALQGNAQCLMETQLMLGDLHFHLPGNWTAEAIGTEEELTSYLVYPACRESSTLKFKIEAEKLPRPMTSIEYMAYQV